MKIKIWILAKLDRFGIKIIPGYEHDNSDRSWAH